MELLLVLMLAFGVVMLVSQSANRKRERQAIAQREGDLDAVRRVADEDVTRFGEELQRLDTDLLTDTIDEPTRQDYQRALDSYESAKEALSRVARPEEIRHVTEALEDGRYAVACVRARVSGQPLPARRPPCFFNPAHGPSATDIDWAPPGGQQRQVPVCLADADRVSQGAEPDVRTIQQGVERVPYWQAGPAYSPYASGYFGAYAMSGLLPSFMLMTMLSPSWDGGGAGAFEDGDDQGSDGGDSGGGDSGGGDSGDGGGDYGDGGGDYGGGGDGGGFDFGGGDGGGFDFGGGGDFGGF